MIRLVNLISKFLVSCDFKGEFNDGKVPKEFVFKENMKISKNLKECKNNRNKIEWFNFCKPICENFKITEFNDYFSPNVEKIVNYIPYLEALINAYEKKKKSNPLFGIGGKTRLLDEDEKDGDKDEDKEDGEGKNKEKEGEEEDAEVNEKMKKMKNK